MLMVLYEIKVLSLVASSGYVWLMSTNERKIKVSDAMRSLGMVNEVNTFVPRYSTVAKSTRQAARISVALNHLELKKKTTQSKRKYITYRNVREEVFFSGVLEGWCSFLRIIMAEIKINTSINH